MVSGTFPALIAMKPDTSNAIHFPTINLLQTKPARFGAAIFLLFRLISRTPRVAVLATLIRFSKFNRPVPLFSIWGTWEPYKRSYRSAV